MATTKRRQRVAFAQPATYGNVAYDPSYAPQREGQERVEPRIRTRERAAAREHVRVRPAGYVAPTAVIGFAMVAVMAVFLLSGYAQATQLSDKIVQLRRESDALSAEHATLTAQYELCFDLKSVEEQVAASGSMVQPQNEQIVTLNIVEPDSARIYSAPGGAITELWGNIGQTLDNLVAFFR